MADVIGATGILRTAESGHRSHSDPSPEAIVTKRSDGDVAQIEANPPDPVSTLEQVPDAGGADLSPPPDNQNPLPVKEIPMSTANDPTPNTTVAAGDSSQGEVAPAASSLATDNVSVAQIKTDPPDPVSPVERVPDPPVGAATTTAPDTFDLEALRLSQNFAATNGLKRVLLSVQVRKPVNNWFVRVHPDAAYRLETKVIELKDTNEMYLVAPSLWSNLGTESTFAARALYTAINRDGVPFIWPVRLPSSEGKIDEWNRTAKEAAALAMKNWVRLAANMSSGTYDVTVAKASLGEPTWPQESFQELINIAFKDRYIKTIDHPVIRKLHGKA